MVFVRPKSAGTASTVPDVIEKYLRTLLAGGGYGVVYEGGGGGGGIIFRN
jgi:hypothetical protein